MEGLELLRTGGGLLAVVGTLYLFVRVLRARTGTLGGEGTARLRVLQRAQLGRRTAVVAVDAGDRVLLLGVSDTGITLLAEQPPLPVADPAAAIASTVTGAAGQALPQLPQQRSALAGSVLSPATWRAALEAVRERTVRR